jgi:hypothetical protein
VGVRRAAPALAALLLAWSAAAQGTSPAERFREAGGHATAGDYPRALQIYAELAAAEHESASLYWNWAQVASVRGAAGEAMWALQRGRELDPGDTAIRREIERLREAANLDASEVEPEPLAALARLSRRLHLDLLALLLLAASVVLHAAARWVSVARWPVAAGWLALGLGLLSSAGPIVGGLARPTAVVVVRGASLLDAASPTAGAIGTLREAEVVPILERSGAYLRIEDGSGARGWAHVDQVRPLAGPR